MMKSSEFSHLLKRLSFSPHLSFVRLHFIFLLQQLLRPCALVADFDIANPPLHGPSQPLIPTPANEALSDRSRSPGDLNLGRRCSTALVDGDAGWRGERQESVGPAGRRGAHSHTRTLAHSHTRTLTAMPAHREANPPLTPPQSAAAQRARRSCCGHWLHSFCSFPAGRGGRRPPAAPPASTPE